MAQYKILYNPLSGNVRVGEIKRKLGGFLAQDSLEYSDITAVDLIPFLGGLDKSDRVLLVGGDGTLNRFINGAGALLGKNSVWYYAAGNGNDFWIDIGRKTGDAPVCIDEYLRDLPEVTVNGKTCKFLNGIGYGIDGYCCEEGDKLRAAGKKVNYTAIAIKGLLFRYKPCKAEITVDGVTKTFKKVWIAPTMNGRYYGGGMIPTPEQNRLNGGKTLSVCVMYGKGKIKTLMLFPKIFKGEHVKKPSMVYVTSGHEITVRFPRPSALQIDGETVLNVTEYTVRACVGELKMAA